MGLDVKNIVINKTTHKHLKATVPRKKEDFRSLLEESLLENTFYLNQLLKRRMQNIKLDDN